VTAFVAWLDQRYAGPGDALAAPGRDLPAGDYERHMKVKRALSPASVNQALPARSPVSLPRGRGADQPQRPLPHPPRLTGSGAWLPGRDGLTTYK
jgi:hypothetical protein